jgi:uncharacterized repeat protein (TIGR01451 family)
MRQRLRGWGSRLVALTLFGASVLVGSVGTIPPAAGATVCAPVVSQLDNASFEAPVLTANYQLIDQSAVPGWSTTATDRRIEIWRSGFNGVPAAAGNQFAELNATQDSALFQDLPTIPGQTLTWSLSHRARVGIDTMSVVIGSPGAAGVAVATFSDSTTAWGRHSGTYVVPAGQTVTRFAFQSGPTGSGNPTVGNFLDDISFGTPACVTATKQVFPSGPANVGDVLTYVVTVANDGGSATSDLSVTDLIPGNTTLIPGSIFPTNGSLSAGAVTVKPVGAANIPGVLEAGGRAAVTFQVRVGAGAAGTTLENRATVTADDPLASIDVFDTNTVTTPVGVPADVEVVKSFGTPLVTSGASTGMTFVVTNNGPGSAADVVVTDTVPAELTVTAVDPSCSLAGAVITCNLGTLASGQVVTLSGFTVLAPTTLTQQTFFNTARVTTSTRDLVDGNNVSTAGLSVDPLAPAQLEVYKDASPTTVASGGVASFVLIAFNAGQTATAAPVTFTDTIPAGFTVTGSSLGTPSCSGTPTVCSFVWPTAIAPGEIVVVTVDGNLTTVRNNTVLTNSVTVTDGTTSAGPATADLTIHNAAQLYVSKTVNTEVYAGEPATYTVTIINAGPNLANLVTLEDVLPAGSSLVAVLGGNANNCGALPGNPLYCDISQLAAGESLAIVYELLIPDDATSVTNTARASSDTPLPNPALATATVTTPVLRRSAEPDQLPDTGVNLSPAAGWSMGLFGAGLAMLLIARRRRS